jgi:hypothetical protein
VSETERETAIVFLPRRTAPAPIHSLARMGMPDAPELPARRSDGEPMAKGRVGVVPNALHRKLAKGS